MKHVYTLKGMLLTAGLLSAFFSNAQSPTVSGPSAGCNIAQNFNLNSGNFSAPSIYSDPNDVSFFWTNGMQVESSGLTTRTASLISPAYSNTESGFSTVGFTYSAPAGTQYRIRVISGNPVAPLQILATTANGPVWTNFPSTSGNLCLQLNDADLTLGAPIRFEFTYRGVAAGNMTFDNFSLATAAGPLPVNFIGFVARKNQDNSVKLLWDVAQEVNVKNYEIEASSNGSIFKNIGNVSAAGKNSYSFNYNQSSTETTFFRIKSVDVDGKFKYTPVIRVNGQDKNVQVQLYPMPAKDQVYLQHEKAPQNASISVISPDGKIIQRLNAVANTIQTSINISRLKAGLYIVRYDDGNGDVQTAKLIKN